MSVNTELLLKTLAHIEANPEQWDQAHWAGQSRGACGSAYCIAGWACVLSGEEADFAGARYTSSLRSGALIYDRATELLGLTDAEASRLYDWTNDLDCLRRIISELTGLDLEDRVVSVHG